MALYANGIEPKEINFNGNTNINVLRVDEVYYWGKPFNLSISVGENISVTVSRRSSQYQHAQTGNITQDDLIYYGDVLRIDATPDTDYVIDELTVNGENFSSGSTKSVSGSISIVVTAKVAPTWKTVWTGSLNFISSNELLYSDKSLTVEGVKANIPTRVSGTAYRTTTNTFSNVKLNSTKTSVVNDAYDTNTVIQYMYEPTEDNKITANVKGYKYIFQGYSLGITLTEIQQYY